MDFNDHQDGLALINTAWDYFWKHCPDPITQAGYTWEDSEEFDAAATAADEILRRL